MEDSRTEGEGTYDTPGILSLARVIEDRVQELQLWKRVCHGAVALAGIAGMFLGHSYAYYTAVFGLLVEFAAFGLRHKASLLHGISRGAMRRVALVSANVLAEDSLEVTQLRAQLVMMEDFKERATRWEARQAGREYYSTKATEPTDRLFDIIFECAFWWETLAQAAAKRAGRWIAAGAIGILLLFSLGMMVGQLETREVIGTLAMQVGLVLIGVDLVENYLKWKDTGAASRELLNRLSGAAPLQEQVLLFLWLSDYFALTAGSPPIPTGVYEAQCDALDAECIRILEQREQSRTRVADKRAALLA